MVCRLWENQTELHVKGTGADELGQRQKMCVVVANEPRSYREAITATLQALRPNIEVRIVEPEELDREVERGAPGLVLCSRATPTVEKEVPVWIELYPEHEPLAVVSISGLCLTAIEDLGFSDLLWILDRAELLAPRSVREG